MQTRQSVDTQRIYDRITQLERRATMDWYLKEQLFQDLFELKGVIHVLARNHEEIKVHIGDYYTKIDNLIDQYL